MKIAIIGYGKMGKEIEQIAIQRGHTIDLKINSSNLADLNEKNLSICDVAIEFSRPEKAYDNIVKTLQLNTPIVVGTTGWYDKYVSISELVKEKKTALLAATNFSIGVNLFFKLNDELAKMMDSYRSYVPTINEIHHLEKLDSPSGTAITLAEGIIANSNYLKSWKNQLNEDPEVLAITSEREKGVPGTHSITYSSDVDEIEIKHKANNRKGFALGAVIAAEFLNGKEGIFSMKDVLNN